MDKGFLDECYTFLETTKDNFIRIYKCLSELSKVMQNHKAAIETHEKHIANLNVTIVKLAARIDWLEINTIEKKEEMEIHIN